MSAPHEKPRAALAYSASARSPLSAEDTHYLEDHEFVLEDDVDPAFDDSGATQVWSEITRQALASATRINAPMRPVPPKPIGPAPEAELARRPRTQAHDVGYERERTRSGVFPVQAPAAITTRTLVEAEAELSRVARQMRARDAYLRELEQALRSSTQQLSAAGLGDIDQAAGLLGRLRGQAFRIAELQSELLQSAAQISELRGENRALRADNREDKPDDLRAIRGIGAHFARQLAELGVASFESIGNWNADDIARIAVQLRIPVARIERDTWIAQARELHAQRQR